MEQWRGVDRSVGWVYNTNMMSDRHTLRWWSVGLVGGYRIDVEIAEGFGKIMICAVRETARIFCALTSCSGTFLLPFI